VSSGIQTGHERTILGSAVERGGSPAGFQPPDQPSSRVSLVGRLLGGSPASYRFGRAVKRFSGDGIDEALRLISTLNGARILGDEWRIAVAEAELDHFDNQRHYQRPRAVAPVPGPRHPPGRNANRPSQSQRARSK
jgi:hypothetical protein